MLGAIVDVIETRTAKQTNELKEHRAPRAEQRLSLRLNRGLLIQIEVETVTELSKLMDHRRSRTHVGTSGPCETKINFITELAIITSHCQVCP